MQIDPEYIDIQKNTLDIIYPAYIRRRLLTKLVDKSLIVNNKRMSNGGNNLFLPDVSYIDDISGKIDFLFRNMNTKTLIDNIEDLEFKKEYRHIVWFEIKNIKIDDILEKISRNEKNSFLVYNSDFNSDKVSENADTITVKQVSSVLFLKFNYLLKPRTGTNNGRNIKYVVLVRLDMEKQILEICFDKVKFDYKLMENYYSELIKSVLTRLQELLGLEIVNIDFKALTYYIKENKDDVSLISMKMRRNGTIAHLDSFENEDFIIPILGELKTFIDLNEEMFTKNQECKEIKEKLVNFIGDIEITSDLPNVKLRWTDQLISLGADHNYRTNEYTLFMLYDELSTERGRIDYVRKYFIQCIDELNKQIQSESLSEESNSANN